MGIYNKIVNDKLEFVNKITELLNNNTIEKKEFENFKDDILKLIGNSCICDVKRKGCKEDNKKDSTVKRKGRKKDDKKKDSEDSKNNNNNNNNNDNDNDNNDNDNHINDNLIDMLLNNKDKFHNLNDKVLNNLIRTAKLKKDILNNSEKIRAIFNKIENVPKNDIRSQFDKYKNLNILLDDLINHIWRLIHGKNRVNDEIDNIDCDKAVDAEIYTKKYIDIVNDKICLINKVSDSIEELMEGLNVDTSKDIAKNEIKDFKSIMIKWVNKFDKYVKQDTKKKDTKRIIQYDANNNNNNNNNKEPDIKQAICNDIKAYIIDEQKLIKKI